MGKEKSANALSKQPIFIDPSLGTKLSVAEAKTVRYSLEGKKKVYTFLPDGAEDLDANRLIAVNYFTYRSNRLVNSSTGKILTQQERNSLISIGKGNLFSYVPEGKTDTEENRDEAVSFSAYQSNKFVNAVTGKPISKNEKTSLFPTTHANTYSFVPDGQEDTDENRLYAVKYYTYKHKKPVNAVTGKPLSENERASLILIADNSNTYSYVPDGMTNAEENRLIAVSGQYYQTYLPLDAFTGKSLSTTERMSITYDVESSFYHYLPDGKSDTKENRLITIGNVNYKRFYLVNSVTGEALTDSEKASLITSDSNTHLYLPDEKEDLPANRYIALSKQAYDSQLNKKIFGKNGYKIQKLTNTQAVLILFCDEQWEVASRHFTTVFMSIINRKCRIAKRKQETHEKPDFQLVIVDNSTLLVLHNPIFVLNLDIKQPSLNI